MIFVILQYIRIVIHMKTALSQGYKEVDFCGERFYPKTEKMLKEHGYLVEQIELDLIEQIEVGFLYCMKTSVRKIK